MSFGENLTRKALLCVLCETNPYGYPGKICGVCYRLTHDVSPPADAPVKFEKPSDALKVKPPKVRPTAAKNPKPVRVPMARQTNLSPKPVQRPKRVLGPELCQWPGCDRKHSMHGACHRDARRVKMMDAVGADPTTWPALWEQRMKDIADLAALNGALNIGLPRGSRKRSVTLGQWLDAKKSGTPLTPDAVPQKDNQLVKRPKTTRKRKNQPSQQDQPERPRPLPKRSS